MRKNRVQFPAARNFDTFSVNMITYDDFKKVELKTAKVLSAERIEGSDKLLKLEVEVGEETRPLVAGIGKAYDLETLVGKMIIIVANLEPKSLLGHESRGMLLAASEDGGAPMLLTIDGDIASGADIR